MLRFHSPWCALQSLIKRELTVDNASGHAGAILQARRLGKQLCVGVHSDQAILEHKGPPVMTLEERSVMERVRARGM